MCKGGHNPYISPKKYGKYKNKNTAKKYGKKYGKYKNKNTAKKYGKKYGK